MPSTCKPLFTSKQLKLGHKENTEHLCVNSPLKPALVTASQVKPPQMDKRCIEKRTGRYTFSQRKFSEEDDSASIVVFDA